MSNDKRREVGGTALAATAIVGGAVAVAGGAYVYTTEEEKKIAEAQGATPKEGEEHNPTKQKVAVGAMAVGAVSIGAGVVGLIAAKSPDVVDGAFERVGAKLGVKTDEEIAAEAKGKAGT